MNSNEKGSIDRAELLARVENDEELAREILGIFQSEVETYRKSLRDAVAARSADDARKAAHAFKGMLANLAAGRASSLASDLEQLAKANKGAELEPVWKIFEDELAGVLADVDHLLAGAAK